MVSSFIEEDAKHGLLEAVILFKIRFFLTWAKTNKKNIYENRYWTYNTVEAWQAQIPYATERQIRHAIEKLIKAKVLIANNFNKHKYDRTRWFSINEDAYLCENIEETNMTNASTCECQIHLPNLTNGKDKDVQPIPINTTNNTTKDPNIYVNPLFSLWNKTVTKLPKALKSNDKRDKASKLLLKENPDLNYWENVIKRMESSLFCNGNNKDGWQAGFDFFLKPETHIKVMEGSYDNRVKDGIKTNKTSFDRQETQEEIEISLGLKK